MKEIGLTLLEVALVLTVIAMAFVGISQMMADNAGQQRARLIGNQVDQVASAASAYISNKKTEIDAFFTANPNATLTIPVAKRSANGSQPVGTAGFVSIQTAGFLQSGFIDQNAAGQSHVLMIKKTPSGLDSLLVAVGGNPIADKDLSVIANTIGAAGGAVYSQMTSTPNTHMVGSAGGWSYQVNQWVGTLDGGPVQAVAGRPAVALSFDDFAANSGSGGASSGGVTGKGQRGTVGYYPRVMLCDFPSNPAGVDDLIYGFREMASDRTWAATGSPSPNVNGFGSTTLSNCSPQPQSYMRVPETGPVVHYMQPGTKSGPTSNGWYSCGAGAAVYSDCHGKTLDELDALGKTAY